MRIHSATNRVTALLALALALALAANGPAVAAERLSMPFNCQFDGERVRMSPSEQRSYEVYGRRESEIYTACSPGDPSRCRSWRMHRFDFSCSGVRVPWIDAAAAGARALGREAWVENGSFRLVMGPMWTNDRPSFGYRGWWRHRYPRDDYSADDGARVVTLPPGYAPALGIPVVFTGTPADEVAQAFPPATVTRAAPARETVPPLPERAPRKPETPPAAAPATVAAPAAAPAPTPEPKVAAAAPSGDAAASTAPPAPASTPPTIINAAPTATPAAPPPAGAVQSVAPVEKLQMRLADASEAKPGMEAATTDAARTPPPAPLETASLPTSSGNDQRRTVMLAAAAAAVLMFASFVVGGLWRRSLGAKSLPPPSARDIASISLGGGPTGTSVALHPKVEPPAVQAPPPLLPSNAGFGSADDVPMPETYDEALEVLGAGPDATLASLKKIVDGMRQSWHPDLARSESDRLVRHRRLQQINVAWDLVSQHRSAA